VFPKDPPVEFHHVVGRTKADLSRVQKLCQVIPTGRRCESRKDCVLQNKSLCAGPLAAANAPFDFFYLVRLAFNFPFNVFRLFAKPRNLGDLQPQLPQEFQSRFYNLQNCTCLFLVDLTCLQPPQLFGSDLFEVIVNRVWRHVFNCSL